MRHFDIQDRNFATPGNKTLENLALLDIGCGGGLISEPMARMGARVTAIDASEKNIQVASLHARESGLDIDYRCTTAEAMEEQFDIVLALEIVEHVADVAAFCAAICKLVRPGGLVIMSTLNRTPESYALAIIGAEYILRWLPVGTHDWHKFLRPSELHAQLSRSGMENMAMAGMVMSKFGAWRIDEKNLRVNYLISGTQPI